MRDRDAQVETSALVAIILEEPGWRQVAEQIVDLSPSAAHLIVLDITARLDVEIRDYASQAILHAIAARERFGPGRRGFNMGDCLSYGAAKERRARLIYVGEDFARTDVNDHV